MYGIIHTCAVSFFAHARDAYSLEGGSIGAEAAQHLAAALAHYSTLETLK
jgi:hypothetical protein